MAQQVALVTGAGSGIGRATAVLLAERGWNLTLVGRRVERLEQTAELLRKTGSKGDVFLHAADLSDWNAAQGAVRACIAKFGRLDALINNAGGAPVATIEYTTESIAREVMGVNLLGPMAMIAAAWPTFAQQRSGCVINVSSMATIDPFPSLFAYAAAKAGLNVMCKSIVNQAREQGLADVRAFAIAPGAVETDMLRRVVSAEALPTSKTLAPDLIASAIVASIEGRFDAQNGGTIPLPSP